VSSLGSKLAAGVLAAALASFGGGEAVAALSGHVATHAAGHAEETSVVEALDGHHTDHGTRPVTMVVSATHPRNHGACVSVVAQSHATTGEAHGDAVSAVAKGDCGKPTNTGVTDHDAHGDITSAGTRGDTKVDTGTTRGAASNLLADRGQDHAEANRP
jgi:hypothetical protein